MADARAVEIVVYDSSSERIMEPFVREVPEDGPLFPTGVRVFAATNESRAFHVEATILGIGRLPIARIRYDGMLPEADADAPDVRINPVTVLFDDLCHGQLCDGSCVEGRCVGRSLPATREPREMLSVCPRHLFVRPGALGDCRSPETPCASIERAVAELGGSDGLIDVDGAAVHPSLVIEGERLTVRRWPGTPAPTINAGGLPTGVEIRGQAITIDDFEVTRASQHGMLIDGPENQQITIRRVQVHDCAFDDNGEQSAGLLIKNRAGQITVEDSAFRDIGSETTLGRRSVGLYINVGSELVLRRNRFERTAGHGLYLGGSNAVTVEDSYFIDSGRTAIAIETSETTLRNNRICNSRGHGVEITGPQPVLVERNSIVRSGLDAVFVASPVSKIVRFNILAFSGGAGLSARPGAELEVERNLYFDNAEGDELGFVAASATSVFGQAPNFITEEDCELAVSEESPARTGDPSTWIGAGARSE